MISYKRDVLEKQSLSEEKIGRCSPIYERVHKKIVEYLKNNRNFRNSGCNTDLMRKLFLYLYINYTISKHLKTLSNEYVCNAWKPSLVHAVQSRPVLYQTHGHRRVSTSKATLSTSHLSLYLFLSRLR